VNAAEGREKQRTLGVKAVHISHNSDNVAANATMVDVSRCNLSIHCTMVETHCDWSRPKPVKRSVKASDCGVNAVRAGVKAVNAIVYSTMVDVNRCNLSVHSTMVENQPGGATHARCVLEHECAVFGRTLLHQFL
jgi:hypothetical protein